MVPYDLGVDPCQILSAIMKPVCAPWTARLVFSTQTYFILSISALYISIFPNTFLLTIYQV